MTIDKIFALWPIQPYGMEDGEDGADNNDDDGAGADDGNDDGADDDSDDDDDDAKKYEGMSAKELRRIAADNEKKAKQAEKDRAAAQKTLTDKEREKLGKDEKRDLDLKESQEREVAKDATISRLSIINGILMNSNFSWHNPEVVAGLLNSDVVKVDSDGKIEGLAKELARVAKDHDYLLKAKPASKDDKGKGGKGNQGNNGQQQNNGQATGQQPGQGGASGGGTLDPNTAELVKNMPALAGRI